MWPSGPIRNPRFDFFEIGRPTGEHAIYNIKPDAPLSIIYIIQNSTSIKHTKLVLMCGACVLELKGQFSLLKYTHKGGH